MDSPDKDTPEIEKDIAALRELSMVRLRFEERICAASASRDEAHLNVFRNDGMFEFAEFYFTLAALGLTGPDDIAIVAEIHNDDIEKLLKDPRAMQRRGLKKDRLLDAMFTADTMPRLVHVWNETPGALDQSNLARLLVAQMSVEKTRGIVLAAEAAGFVTRTKHVTGGVVVKSTGAMERVLGECLREMRANIVSL